MPFTHTTRRGKTYFLHTGPKRGGGVQHFLSTDPQGPLADVVPEGFEVYETVNARVYLRRKKPSSIHDAELSCVRREQLARVRGRNLYDAEVDRETIVIHESTTDTDFSPRFGALPGIDVEAISRQLASYMPVMRFVLQDKTRRLFRTERYCFRGSVDDWISIGAPDEMEPLAAKFIPHLGRDSFYELYRY